MTKKMKKTLLEAALGYHERGWCVIPIPYKTKIAIICWKRYQNEQPSEEQICKWFGNRPMNMAVVLGEVSGHLVCRDFDDEAEYDRWADQHGELARTLPTVKTIQGRHVYFHSSIKGVKKIEKGELRSKGGYCLLPPSLHPDGKNYQWINPPTNDNLLTISPEEAGFINPNVTEKTEYTDQTEQIEAIRGVCLDVKEAIRLTLPVEYGTRNRKIFELARHLKAMANYSDADPMQLRVIVQDWHQRALPNIRTKEFEETWIDFLKAWPQIKYPAGKEPIAMVFQNAIQLEPPPKALEKYPGHPNIQILASLCRELQRSSGEEPFFLSCRTAGQLLKVTPMTISRWMFLLEQDGFVTTVQKGGTAQTVRKATRYKFTNDQK